MKLTRKEKMLSLYKKGKSLQNIGDIYGITRERVRQLLTGFKEYHLAKKNKLKQKHG